jgi:hypothetical protein
MPRMPWEWPSSVCVTAPVARFHILTVPSSEEEASWSPRSRTPYTGPLCSSSVLSACLLRGQGARVKGGGKGKGRSKGEDGS